MQLLVGRYQLVWQSHREHRSFASKMTELKRKRASEMKHGGMSYIGKMFVVICSCLWYHVGVSERGVTVCARRLCLIMMEIKHSAAK